MSMLRPASFCSDGWQCPRCKTWLDIDENAEKPSSFDDVVMLHNRWCAEGVFSPEISRLAPSSTDAINSWAYGEMASPLIYAAHLIPGSMQINATGANVRISLGNPLHSSGRTELVISHGVWKALRAAARAWPDD